MLALARRGERRRGTVSLDSGCAGKERGGGGKRWLGEVGWRGGGAARYPIARAWPTQPAQTCMRSAHGSIAVDAVGVARAGGIWLTCACRPLFVRG